MYESNSELPDELDIDMKEYLTDRYGSGVSVKEIVENGLIIMIRKGLNDDDSTDTSTIEDLAGSSETTLEFESPGPTKGPQTE